MSQTLVARSLFPTVEPYLQVSLLASFWFSLRSLLPYRPVQRSLLRITRAKFSMVPHKNTQKHGRGKNIRTSGRTDEGTYVRPQTRWKEPGNEVENTPEKHARTTPMIRLSSEVVGSEQVCLIGQRIVPVLFTIEIMEFWPDF